MTAGEGPPRLDPARYVAINRKFRRIMLCALTAYLSSVALLKVTAGLGWPETLAIVTILFQAGLIGWGISFIGSYFVRMEVKTDLSLELGQRTSGLLEEVRAEVKPVVADTRATAADVKQLVAEFREKDFPKLEQAIDRVSGALNKDLVEEIRGTFQKAEGHLARIAERVAKDTEPLRVRRREGPALCPTCQDTVDSPSHQKFCLSPGVGHADGQ